jgi:L-ascorbate metabolism protein UlaG (beta-lactamase superfamily)
MPNLSLTYIGGPTVLIEFGGLRLLTDPTFDSEGSELSPGGAYTLCKTTTPAVPAESLGKIDVVLLSHDHHYDNLDIAGKEVLGLAATTLTTPVGAERLGGNAVGLAHWSTFDLPTPDGDVLHVVGTPARHGPEGGDRGPVTGFALTLASAPSNTVYVAGDTVWYDGVEQVSRRFDVRLAMLFFGAAKVAVAGPSHLTMTAEEGVTATRRFPNAVIVPVHFEGWKHFTESRADIEYAFDAEGLSQRLLWLEPGSPTTLAL